MQRLTLSLSLFGAPRSASARFNQAVFWVMLAASAVSASALLWLPGRMADAGYTEEAAVHLLAGMLLPAGLFFVMAHGLSVLLRFSLICLAFWVGQWVLFEQDAWAAYWTGATGGVTPAQLFGLAVALTVSVGIAHPRLFHPAKH